MFRSAGKMWDVLEGTRATGRTPLVRDQRAGRWVLEDDSIISRSVIRFRAQEARSIIYGLKCIEKRTVMTRLAPSHLECVRGMGRPLIHQGRSRFIQKFARKACCLEGLQYLFSTGKVHEAAEGVNTIGGHIRKGVEDGRKNKTPACIQMARLGRGLAVGLLFVNKSFVASSHSHLPHHPDSKPSTKPFNPKSNPIFKPIPRLFDYFSPLNNPPSTQLTTAVFLHSSQDVAQRLPLLSSHDPPRLPLLFHHCLAPHCSILSNQPHK